MARTKEYQSRGGAFKKLEDALSSIDGLLEEVKKAGSESAVVHSEVKELRNVAGRLQTLFMEQLTSLKESWRDIGLDPVPLITQEHISGSKYVQRIQLLHPIYDHVWVTDLNGNDLSEELIPHIVFEMSYIHKQRKLVVNTQMLEVQLNLPEFKSSLEAAHMDLEIVRHDAKHVEKVTDFGKMVRTKLTEALQEFCEAADLTIEVNEFAVDEIISSGVFAERKRPRKKVVEDAAFSQEEEKALQQQTKEEEAAAEAKRLKLEEQKRQAAQRKAEREQRQREQEELAKKEAEEAARQAAEEVARKEAEEAEGEVDDAPTRIAPREAFEPATNHGGPTATSRGTQPPPLPVAATTVRPSSIPSTAPTMPLQAAVGQVGGMASQANYPGPKPAPEQQSHKNPVSVPPPIPIKKPSDPIY